MEDGRWEIGNAREIDEIRVKMGRRADRKSLGQKNGEGEAGKFGGRKMR